MIGVDTNILIRRFVDDDHSQALAVKALMEAQERRADPMLVTSVVFAETEWSLRSNFEFTKARIIEVFDEILSDPSFFVDEDDREAVDAALEAWRTGAANFSDYLIGALARQRGARTTITFDRKAAQSEAFTFLEH